MIPVSVVLQILANHGPAFGFAERLNSLDLPASIRQLIQNRPRKRRDDQPHIGGQVARQPVCNRSSAGWNGQLVQGINQQHQLLVLYTRQPVGELLFDALRN